MSDPKYDVFLSFRREDTRHNFTSHLYAELRRRNIKTFKDDDELERGDEINSSLVEAIKASTIYVIILSEHYASSSWCLDELTEILKSKKEYKREVIPVFYKVDPSNVRHQRHSYADDLVKHNQQFGGKVDAWKAALTQVAGLSGWDSQVTSPESILVEKIAEDILKKLNRHVSSGYYEGLTGMDKHIEEIQSLLQLELPTVRMIGIWGMGGIGKSTIASAVFEKFETQFNSRCCIVPNVQQEIEKTDVEHVKNKYLSKLLKEDIKSSESNSSIVRKLKRAKVLLVFDDVKDFDQLQNLNGTHDNFIEGSRIIVTSRDKQVLENANADKIYKVSEMDYQDSLQLFHSFAFKHNRPIEETYMSLSKEVLDYAQGLPLALKVLGSMLYGKPKEVWESQLQKLKKLPDHKIFSLLKLSYDGLDSEQKNIFLDIACFFIGEWEKVVALILDSCGFSACKGMDDLKDRGLISISKGRVWMHDLIQEMGHEIVKLQCDDDPGKRSRLWKPSDIYDVLSNNKGKGTNKIQCIFLNMWEMSEMTEIEVQLDAETFEEMHNLRMIKFYNHYCEPFKIIILKSFPKHLKFLCWDGFPQRSLPQDFCPKNVVILDMPDSHLEQLWEGDQALPKLKRLNLSHSKKLVRVQDLSLSPNIEEVILSGCESLIEVYSSAFLDNLNWLWLGHCSKLERLDIRSNILWRSFGLVNLDCCYKLETLLISGRTDVVQSYIYSDNCVYSDLEGYYLDWPQMSIRRNDEGDYEILNRAESTVVTSSNELCWLHIASCKSLTCLPAELFNFKFLRRLCLSGCSKFEVLPEFKETMENLKVLILDKTTIKELPSSLHHLVGLEKLSLQGCTKLKTIPSSIGNLSKLLKLELSFCESLETFPSSIFKLKLTRLNFFGCQMLGTFPKIPNEFGSLSSLSELSLQGTSIVNLPESMAHLSSLRSLDISDCKLLECVPKLPPNLIQVWAFDCPSIKRMMLNSGSDSKEDTFKYHLTNCQEVDATSLSNIEEEAYIKINDDAYSSVLFCFPGSAVPDWFPHRCQGHSITIRSDDLYLYERNKLIGFALCVVLGRDFPYDTYSCFWKSTFSDISFAYALKFEFDGQTHFHPRLEIKFDWWGRNITHDHTFLWKYELDNGVIEADTITFEILDEHGSSLSIPATMTVKECGICPLYTKQNEEPSGDVVCLVDPSSSDN